MDFSLEYKTELNKLIENENDFEFFRNLILNTMDSNKESCKIILDELLKFAGKYSLKKTKAQTYYYIGCYCIVMSEYDKAVDYFFISNDLFDNIGDKRGLIFVCNGLSTVYCVIGQFKLANEWGLKGISLCEEINEKNALVILLINTGINYINMKFFEKASEVFNSIHMMDCDLTNRQYVSYKHALAEIEINIGNPNKALAYLEESSQKENLLISGEDISETYKLKGMAYFKLNEYNLAEKEFIKSCNFSNGNGYTYQRCSAMLERAKLCFFIENNDFAIKLLKDVVSVSKHKELKTILRESYHMLYTIYKKLNNIEMSLYYLEEYIMIDDEMYDYEQNQLMAKMNIKHSNRKADLYKLLYDKTELLSSIGQKIISNLDVNSIIDVIIKEINPLIETDIFGLAVYISDKGEAVYSFVNKDSSKKHVVSFKIDDDFALGAYCIRNKEDIIIGNLEQEYVKYSKSYQYHMGLEKENPEKSMIYTPLIINDKVVGLMTVQSYSENAYDKNDLNTLKIIANYSAIAIDNAMSYKKVEEIATYDNMTGFLTRFEIIRLGELLYKQYKADDGIKFSVIMIDIDNFKVINDTYGHINGDKAITMVAGTISKCIRATDYIGRYGGDEFLLICSETSKSEAIDVAERIRNTISSNIYSIDNCEYVKITISLGVYEFSKNDMSFFDGVKEADKCLYNAKKGSKNKVSYNL